ncbi:MAG: T9SS type A sorting domain-containing protein [bacterium]|nr:T9SS type A sorting domain-containing protein [bacterium]
MRSLITSLFLLIFLNIGFASAQDTLWTRTYGESDHDVAECVIQTYDGNIVLAGTINSNAGIIKANYLGDSLWTRTFGIGHAYSIVQTTDEGFIIVGSRSLSHLNSDVYLIKTDNNGNIEWYKTYGGSEIDTGFDIDCTEDGGYIIAGYSKSFNDPNDYDIFVLKTDSLGDTLWTRAYGGDDHDEARAILQTGDGGYILAGSSRSFTSGSVRMYLIKLNGVGDTVWTRTYGSYQTEGNTVRETTDGGYIAAGYFSGGGSIGVYLVKTNIDGDTMWTRELIHNSANAYSVQQTIDNGYIIVGRIVGHGGDMFILKTDTMGYEIWQRTYGGDRGDVASSIYPANDGIYLIAGSTSSFTGLDDDLWLLKHSGELDVIYNPQYFKFDIVKGTQDTAIFKVSSNTYNDYIKLHSDSQWVLFYPDSVVLAPTDTVQIKAVFNASGLDYKTFYTQLYVLGREPENRNVYIPVEMTVYPAVDIDVNIPINNLQAGDTLSAYITVTNPTYFNTKAWIATAMTLPNDQLYGPVFGPYDFRLFPYGTVSGRIDHVVPGYAMHGDYEYLVRVSPKADLLTIMGQNGADFSVYSSSGITNIYNDDPWQVTFSGFNEEYNQSLNLVSENTPYEITLYQNKPNPFNASTQISFTLPYQSDVRLNIYNLSGQRVETLIDKQYPTGEHSVIWDASEYSSGVYFYKLSAGENTFTKRMTVLK